MAKSQKALAVNNRADNRDANRDEPEASQRPVSVLEKQFLDTLELIWHVKQARIRLNGEGSMKIRLLFDGMASELEIYSEMIRKRLESSQTDEPHAVEVKPGSFWRLFAAEELELREQLESLLCGYAHYARQTSDAMVSLLRAGDLESSELLASVFKASERCLWFLEIYLEGLALNTDSAGLPDWPA